jgi:hypothetical protein
MKALKIALIFHLDHYYKPGFSLDSLGGINLAGGTFMAIGWLAVLKSVPWSEVISNAPKVADGSRKLWNAVARKSFPPEVADPSTQPAVSPESQTMAALAARAITLEAAVSDLQGQMLASSELIKALADQNAQLIQGIETNRVRVLWLSATIALVAIAALLALFLAFLQHGA